MRPPVHRRAVSTRGLSSSSLSDVVTLSHYGVTTATTGVGGTTRVLRWSGDVYAAVERGTGSIVDESGQEHVRADATVYCHVDQDDPVVISELASGDGVTVDGEEFVIEHIERRDTFARAVRLDLRTV